MARFPGGGTPDAMRELRAQAPAGVVFRGALDGTALRRVYQQATLAVFTPHAEEFGLAPLEAMACGRPVICSSSPLKGIAAEPGLHLLRADSAEEWAAAVGRYWD